MKLFRNIAFGLLFVLSLTGCTTAQLRQAETVTNVAFLASNYKSVEVAIAELPLNAGERILVDEGLAQWNVLRSDLSSLVNGDVNTDKVLDYATGTSILVRVAESYDLTKSGLKLYWARTKTEPSEEFLDFNRRAVNLAVSIQNYLDANKSVKADVIIELVKQGLRTYTAVATGNPLLLVPKPKPQGSSI